MAGDRVGDRRVGDRKVGDRKVGDHRVGDHRVGDRKGRPYVMRLPGSDHLRRRLAAVRTFALL